MATQALPPFLRSPRRLAFVCTRRPSSLELVTRMGGTFDAELRKVGAWNRGGMCAPADRIVRPIRRMKRTRQVLLLILSITLATVSCDRSSRTGLSHQIHLQQHRQSNLALRFRFATYPNRLSRASIREWRPRGSNSLGTDSIGSLAPPTCYSRRTLSAGSMRRSRCGREIPRSPANSLPWLLTRR
jgi:hypothetical protein